MITVYMLENNDVIQATDFVRQLRLTYEGQSDYLVTTSAYGGTRINRTGWMRAEEVCPYWVGKKVDAFNKGMDFMAIARACSGCGRRHPGREGAWR